MAGDGWTGAFGTGIETILSAETSSVSPEERENNFKRNDQIRDLGEIVNVAAGWGHSVIVCKGDQNETKLYVAGRPFDFQALLRLYRLPSFIRRSALSLSLNLDESTTRKSVMPYFEEITLPNGDTPSMDTNNQILAASAGLTAIIGKSGKAYMFGLNKSGQCGVGDSEAIHIWEPTPITLSKRNEELVVKEVALGLQHGLVLGKDGSLYAFGKGSRGQLGIADQLLQGELKEDLKAESNGDFAFSPIRINEFELQSEHLKPSKLSDTDSEVLKISAGWNHSASVTKSNHVWIWGKNVLIDSLNGSKTGTIDSMQPIHIKGLPERDILDISCGSHHTSILLEDGSVYATGIATDTNNPVGGESAVQLVPPGIIDLPIRQFKSHFDRTTIIAGEDGQQILEAQLWSTADLRREAVFEPAWVETVFGACEEVKSIHRGWLHTIILGQRDPTITLR